MFKPQRLSYSKLEKVVAGSRKHLIIDDDIDKFSPIIIGNEGYRLCSQLVFNWNGRWGGENLPDRALVVMPGEEFDLVEASGAGASLWLRPEITSVLRCSFNVYEHDDNYEYDGWMRIDVVKQLQTITMRDYIADPDIGQAVFSLRISQKGQKPKPPPGGGMTGSLTPTRP
jgi:hypothetical protein